MIRVYLNGKFTAQPLTGVQRVASCLVQALDAQLTGRPWCCVLLCPVGGRPPTLTRISVRHVGTQGLPLHLWEQVVLPWAASPGLLVNLAGAAPWWSRRQVCMIHDAAVFDVPQAYTRLFRGWYRLLFRHLARRAVRLLTVSSFSRERLAFHLDMPGSAIAVICNGSDHLESAVADEGVLARFGLQGTRFILAVGSANPAKNIAVLLSAYARMPAAGEHRLVIVGGRDERVFADSTARTPPGVVRVGPVRDAELKALYDHAVALAFPSIYEGFGLPPLEAMSRGCPVAAARAAAIPEVCGDAVIYFDPHSIDDLAVTLGRLLRDAPLRERLAAGGPARAGRFRWAGAAGALRAEIDLLTEAPPLR